MTRAEVPMTVKDHVNIVRELYTLADTPQAGNILLQEIRSSQEHKDILHIARQAGLAFRDSLPIPSSATLFNIRNAEEQNGSIELATTAVFTKALERPLTRRDTTIQWAHEVSQQYEQMPKGNVAQRKEAKRILDGIYQRFLENPDDIDTAGSAWKARELEEGTGTQTSFYEVAKQHCTKKIKDHWDRVTGEQLGQITRVYAHSELAKDLAEAILQSYFKGPTSRNQRVDALYNFAFGAIDLIDDVPSLEEAIKIGSFRTNVIPRGSEFHVDYYITRFIPINDSLLGRAMNAEAVLIDLHFLTSLTRDQVLGKFDNLADDPRHESRIEKAIDNASRSLGRTVYNDRVKRLLDYSRAPLPMSSERELKRMEQAWPYSLTYGSDDPLRLRYREEAAYRTFRRRLNQRYLDYLTSDPDKKYITISLPLPEGYTVDVYLPEEFSEKRDDALKLLLSEITLTDEEKKMFDHEDKTYVGLSFHLRAFEGSFIYYSKRPLTEYEKNQHEIAALQEIGFPTPKLEVGEDIRKRNAELAEEIHRTQLRFLNKRGVRIPLRPRALRRLGYQHIDFRKDAQDPEKIEISIKVGGFAYKVKLDRYFNFDLEGKSFQAPDLQDALHHTLLSLLKPILCEEALGKDNEDSPDLETHIKTRMGHLRLLKEGKRYTSHAVALCFEHEGRDLTVIDAERKQRKSTTRYTTYVKPVYKAEEDLDPITIQLPDALRF